MIQNNLHLGTGGEDRVRRSMGGEGVQVEVEGVRGTMGGEGVGDTDGS